jgi:hypothetical protein
MQCFIRRTITNLVLIGHIHKKLITRKEKIQHCLQSNLNAKSLQVISKNKKTEIPPRHKSFIFFQKLTGIDRRTIQRWVLDKDLRLF